MPSDRAKRREWDLARAPAASQPAGRAALRELNANGPTTRRGRPTKRPPLPDATPTRRCGTCPKDRQVHPEHAFKDDRGKMREYCKECREKDAARKVKQKDRQVAIERRLREEEEAAQELARLERELVGTQGAVQRLLCAYDAQG
jgi:hypothetical protein